jgi:hypothetical protein
VTTTDIDTAAAEPVPPVEPADHKHGVAKSHGSSQNAAPDCMSGCPEDPAPTVATPAE